MYSEDNILIFLYTFGHSTYFLFICYHCTH